jgi:hypothetical protein
MKPFETIFGGNYTGFHNAPNWNDPIWGGNIVVAKRVANEIYFRRVNDAAPSRIRSGEYDQWTQVFELVENSSNSWGSTANLEPPSACPTA